MLLYDDYRNITRHFPSSRERPSDDDNWVDFSDHCYAMSSV